MQQDFLSDIELYYSNKVAGNLIEIDGEEHHHIKDVMRHKVDDEIYVTDGKGNIYKTKICLLDKKYLRSSVKEKISYKNDQENITFCIPRLRSADRFEFALEKCVELGITEFIVFDSKRTIAKGEKIDRWQKILTSAMKQSLRAWLPKVTYAKSVEEIKMLNGIKIIFDQHAGLTLQSFLESNHQTPITKHYFIFGPEGGLTEEELNNSEIRIKLTENRLRSETAIIAAATEISLRAIQ